MFAKKKCCLDYVQNIILQYFGMTLQINPYI